MVCAKSDIENRNPSNQTKEQIGASIKLGHSIPY